MPTQTQSSPAMGTFERFTRERDHYAVAAMAQMYAFIPFGSFHKAPEDCMPAYELLVNAATEARLRCYAAWRAWRTAEEAEEAHGKP